MVNSRPSGYTTYYVTLTQCECSRRHCWKPRFLYPVHSSQGSTVARCVLDIFREQSAKTSLLEAHTRLERCVCLLALSVRCTRVTSIPRSFRHLYHKVLG